MSTFRVCALIPTYDNPGTIACVVQDVRAHVPDVLIVDDGSGPDARRVIDELVAQGLARLVRHAANSGKGAAVKTGLRVARELGFTHTLQLDADCQHSADDIPRFLQNARDNPSSLVIGAPQFDASAPRARLFGRKITVFWARLETFGASITDPLCGYRVYPIDCALASAPHSNHMEFDPEIAVRMAWLGAPVCNVPTQVRYVARAQGGVSHFRMVRDNIRISWMHTRLMCTALLACVLRRSPAALATGRLTQLH